MTTQIIFILLCVLLISISNITTKVALRKDSNVSAFIAFHNIAGGLIVLPLVFFDHRLPTDILPWIYLSIGVIAAILGNYYYFNSMAIEEMSVITLVSRLRSVLVFIFGTILFRESITQQKILSMILTTIGSLIVGYRKGKFHLSKGVVLVLMANLFLGIMFIVDKKVTSSISIPLYCSVNCLTSGFFFFALSLKQHQTARSTNSHDKTSQSEDSRGAVFLSKTSLKQIFRDVNFPAAMASGTLLSLASLSRRYSFNLGEISFATPLLNLSVVLTMFLGIVVLKERDKLWQKIAGLGIIIAGAALLG